jgi:addiction module HigA family antidote
MQNPLHPGEFVRYGCLERAGLTVIEGAKALGVTRQALYSLINCRSGVSPKMANRLSKVFGGTPAIWLRMQMVYNLTKTPDESESHPRQPIS